jgi:hypothetical protein
MAATSLFTPGPAEIAVRIAGTYEYLGTTVNGARSRAILHTGNVQGDPAGVDGMPLDMRMSGRGIVVTMQINKYDPSVMNAMEARFLGGFTGSVGVNEVGSLALTEGLTFELLVRSRYSFKTQFLAFNNGIHLLWAICNGELGRDYSTKEQVVDLTFFGFVNLILPPSDPRYGTCYDFDMTGFPEPT